MIQKILVFSFSFIGDAVLSTAVISPLRHHFPDAKITFLVGVRAFNLLASDPQIDQVLAYDNRGEHAGWRGKVRLIKALRHGRFDLVVDLRDSIWSRCVGGKHWGMQLRGKDIHAVTRYLDVLQRHGVDTGGAQPRLQFTDGEMKARARFLAENGIDRNRILIGIHPGGNWAYKLWQPENFARIADDLCEKWNAQILTFAGPDEYSLQVQVADLMRWPSIRVKERDLRRVAALIEMCELYIGNDTGPMHIAAAVGTPVIAIFGSTNHHRSGPYGEEHIVVQSGVELACNPCHPGKHAGGCGAGSCAVIEAITVEQVFRAIERLRMGMKR
ncbi:MAG: glycosyltransferase family 9 protein [Candidatus Poribacteria bacterium]|nr:glycosyltransferase family 9 protein [Candidatus Poribacteria bacterium]